MRHLFVLCAILIGIVNTLTSENNGTVGESVDGNELIKLGRKFHKARLTIIGMAIKNQQNTIQTQQTAIQNLQQTIENQLNTTQIQQTTIQKLQKTIHNLHPCGEWTPWSPCDALKRGYFGSQTRTRSCADTENLDQKTMTAETDQKLCEGFCPVSYILTNNGFCIKLNTTSVTNDVAVEQCKQEGGFLIHIDSQTKFDDFKSTISGVSTNFHIDGRRKDSSSPWEYQYGSQSAFLKWQSGYPTKQLCLDFQISYHTQFDYTCSYSTSFACEILNISA